jgi:hypothetical protein
MKNRVVIVSALLLISIPIAAVAAPLRKVKESLTGLEEAPLALSTAGSGEFTAKISKAGDQIEYELSYAGLEGEVTQAHIHFGSRSQAGGVAIFLCTNLGNGPAGTQACPAAPATITGTIVAADVIGPAGQGITAGQLEEVLAAMKDGATYVNVHSALYPGGEIRAQIR